MALNSICTSHGILIDVCVYPDGEAYQKPPSWKSDDYEVRKQGYCGQCDQSIVPHYSEPFASCECYTQEWHR